MSLAALFDLEGSFAGRKRQLMGRDGQQRLKIMRHPSRGPWALDS